MLKSTFYDEKDSHFHYEDLSDHQIEKMEILFQGVDLDVKKKLLSEPMETRRIKAISVSSHIVLVHFSNTFFDAYNDDTVNYSVQNNISEAYLFLLGQFKRDDCALFTFNHIYHQDIRSISIPYVHNKAVHQ